MVACGGDNTDETTGVGTDAVTVAGTDVEEITNAPSDEEVTTATAGDVTAAEVGTADVEAGTSAGEDGTVAGDEIDWDNYDFATDSLWLKKKDGEQFVEYGERSAYDLAGHTVGTKFTVDEGWVSALTVRCPSWNDNEGTLIFTLYEWVEDQDTLESAAKVHLEASYALTVASTPVAQETIVDYSDNENIGLFFESMLAVEGHTYLLTVTNPNEETYDAGVYITSQTVLSNANVRGPKFDDTEKFEYNSYISNAKAFVDGAANRLNYMELSVEVAFEVTQE